MFGRKFTKSAWLKLGGLTLAVFALVFIVCAPLATVTVRIDLPPASITPKPPSASEWLIAIALPIGAFATVSLLIVAAIWLIVRTARKIILSQPELK